MHQKREKFSKQIRKTQHQHYFDIQRQAYQNSQLPVLAYLPILIENQLYEDIEQILECIEIPQCNEQTFDQLKATIRKRYEAHDSIHVRELMFRLLNRLNAWNDHDLLNAIQILQNGQHNLIKQICILLEVRSNKQQPHKYLKQIFEALVFLKLKQPELKIFWLDIVCQALQTQPVCIDKCRQNSTQFMKSVDIGLECGDFQLIRILHMASVFVQWPELRIQLINLQCFPRLVKLIQNGAIDVVILGFDIIGQLLSHEDTIVEQLVNKYDILKLLTKYIDHIMVGVQSRVIWCLSNIGGSQNYQLIINKHIILDNIKTKLGCGFNIKIRLEAIICFFNLLCNAVSQQLEQLNLRYNVAEMIIFVFEQLDEPTMRQSLLPRVMYSIYHIMNISQSCLLTLQQLGLNKLLERAYQQQKIPSNTAMINQILIGLENRKN